MKIRTINQASAYFKAQDPATMLKAHTLRELARTGEIKSIKSGNRILIDVEDVERKFTDERI